VLDPGFAVVTDGRFASVGSGPAPRAGAEVVDLAGRWVLPGFVDLHTHGGHGAQFASDDPAGHRTDHFRQHAHHGRASIW
jgi:N-acetylglucosamine-6-phosphate deacetylase